MGLSLQARATGHATGSIRGDPLTRTLIPLPVAAVAPPTVAANQGLTPGELGWLATDVSHNDPG